MPSTRYAVCVGGQQAPENIPSLVREQCGALRAIECEQGMHGWSVPVKSNSRGGDVGPAGNAAARGLVWEVRGAHQGQGIVRTIAGLRPLADGTTGELCHVHMILQMNTDWVPGYGKCCSFTRLTAYSCINKPCPLAWVLQVSDLAGQSYLALQQAT